MSDKKNRNENLKEQVLNIWLEDLHSGRKLGGLTHKSNRYVQGLGRDEKVLLFENGIQVRFKQLHCKVISDVLAESRGVFLYTSWVTVEVKYAVGKLRRETLDAPEHMLLSCLNRTHLLFKAFKLRRQRAVNHRLKEKNPGFYVAALHKPRAELEMTRIIENLADQEDDLLAALCLNSNIVVDKVA